jgi:hypothetical protein
VALEERLEAVSAADRQKGMDAVATTTTTTAPHRHQPRSDTNGEVFNGPSLVAGSASGQGSSRHQSTARKVDELERMVHTRAASGVKTYQTQLEQRDETIHRLNDKYNEVVDHINGHVTDLDTLKRYSKRDDVDITELKRVNQAKQLTDAQLRSDTEARIREGADKAEADVAAWPTW